MNSRQIIGNRRMIHTCKICRRTFAFDHDVGSYCDGFQIGCETRIAATDHERSEYLHPPSRPHFAQPGTGEFLTTARQMSGRRM